MKTICIQFTDDNKIFAYRATEEFVLPDDRSKFWTPPTELKLHAAVVAKELESLTP